MTISGQQADAADAVAEADVARTGGSTNSTISLERAASRARPVAQSLVSDAAHEQIVFCNHPPSRLRAVIAIYSTQLGPALGGTRFYPYHSDEAAIADVLNLSKAMAYKNALAGLDLGGGKAVIIGDPEQLKSEALLCAYGRFVQSLNGRYITACDIGTYCPDMDIIARECKYVTGRTEPHGGAGDSSVLTAFGVFQGMRAAAEYAWGSPSLDGRVVAVEGVGKVGSHLIGHLLADGAKVVVYDVSATAVQRVLAQYPPVAAVSSLDALVSGDIDVYAPCALGGSLDGRIVPNLRASIVCGGANNQLAYPAVQGQLSQRGVVYAPDYVVNAGGVIQVADELEGFSFERAKQRTAQIFETTKQIFAIADKDNVAPGVAAGRLAERRMSDIGKLKGIWLAG